MTTIKMIGDIMCIFLLTACLIALVVLVIFMINEMKK